MLVKTPIQCYNGSHGAEIEKHILARIHPNHRWGNRDLVSAPNENDRAHHSLASAMIYEKSFTRHLDSRGLRQRLDSGDNAVPPCQPQLHDQMNGATHIAIDILPAHRTAGLERQHHELVDRTFGTIRMDGAH